VLSTYACCPVQSVETEEVDV